eukprot:5831222-Alexandrium_andersonii.AAC.1
MSASLVGSEMCIRDRYTSEGHIGKGHEAARDCGGGGKQRTLRSGTKPVSYTHLTLPTICSV